MKVGDRVKIVRDNLGTYKRYIGRTGVILDIRTDNPYPITIVYDNPTEDDSTWVWATTELVVINKEDNVRKLLSRLDV